MNHPSRIGPYVVLDTLRQNTMSRIYHVRRTNARDEYAIKTLIAGRLADAESLGRFRREVALASQVQHPNVCRVTDWGYWEESVPYMTQELLAGQSLDELITGPLPLERVRDWLSGALSGLEAIHQAGIVHRGMAPSNLFITEAGCKILDFGMAGQTRGEKEPWTADGASLGIFPYIAPEALFDARKAGPLSDLFVLGLVFHQCLAGTLPYRSEARRDVLHGATSGELQSLAAVRPDVPEALVDWGARLLRSLPHERFASARDALQALP